MHNDLTCVRCGRQSLPRVCSHCQREAERVRLLNENVELLFTALAELMEDFDDTDKPSFRKAMETIAKVKGLV